MYNFVAKSLFNAIPLWCKLSLSHSNLVDPSAYPMKKKVFIDKNTTKINERWKKGIHLKGAWRWTALLARTRKEVAISLELQ